MRLLALLSATFLLAGCLTAPVASSGGISGRTVQNSNPNAIISAALQVFPQYGYSQGPADYPQSISFDKPGGLFANAMWGSYGEPVSVRARLNIVPIPGTNDYRISVSVARVTDAGEAGFEDSTRMAGAWSGEFNPLLRQIVELAGGAGAGTAPAASL